MIEHTDYKDFYEKLFAEIAKKYGPLDKESIVSIIGFDAGGPVNLSKIDKIGLYVTCELCCRDDQKPSSFGNYELMIIGKDTEKWARNILTEIGRMTLDEVIDHHHTINFSEIVDKDDSIKGVIFEKYSSIIYKKKSYGIMLAIGITLPELELCYESGVQACLKKLIEAKIYPNTILER